MKSPYIMRDRILRSCMALAFVWLACMWLAPAYGQMNRQSAPPPGPQDTEKTKPGTQPDANSTTTPGAVAPGVGAPVDPNSYQIGPNDVLTIRVWREPELSGPVQVRPDGKINLPLAGELQAAGMTPEQLRTAVTEALGKFINKPEVIIIVQQVLSKKYYISGGMQRTGTFPLVVPVTVLEAIANAGGFREFANRKKIVILRGNERIKFNYNEVMKGKHLEQNIFLKDGDHIFVPE